MSRGPAVHELIRASAGTGKTFQITNRIVGLLAAGARPDAVLAATFTRKAAGEILDRVLLRLAGAALDEGAARELAAHAALPAEDGRGAPALDREGARRLLASLVRALHRIDVGTLDAYFLRLARSFSPELGLPLDWEIGDEPSRESLRSEAVQRLLDRRERADLVELLRLVARGDADRRVHDALVEDVDELRGLLRELDPDAVEPWSPLRTEGSGRDTGAARADLADRISDVEPPRNKSGAPDARWAPALEAAAGAVRDGRWEDLLSGGLGAKRLAGDTSYYSRPFPPELSEALGEAIELARAELAPRLDGEARALGRIAELYDRALEDLQRRAGSYRFDDIAWAVGAGRRLAGREDLSHRLDRRSDHLLLDEFQDTSLLQWAALEPLVDEVAPRGSLVVVADPKQSIYGWRNADPELVERVRERYRLPTRGLHESWRSSAVVLDFVNLLFGSIAANPVLEPLEAAREVTGAWASTFEPHAPAPPLADRPGRVTVEFGPDDGSRSADRPRLMARAAERVAELHRRVPGAEIGVLVYRNRTVARLIHELRARDVRASEEGGTPVDDAAPVAAVLALLELADHPGDRIARYHVAAGPLGRVVGYRDHADDAGAAELAADVRRRLLRDGYGTTLWDWALRLAPHVDAGELRRLEQLAELGFRWEDRATLRPGDFVRFVRSQKVEDPLSAPVRVMTVHQAKGLEFDIVVLPELDVGLKPRAGGEAAVPERDPDTGRVLRVFPYVNKELRSLFPELETAYRQRAATGLRDRLSWLYVAVTRARSALHLILAADEGPRRSRAASFSRLVRAALDVHEDPAPEGSTIYEAGREDWHRDAPELSEAPAPPATAELELRVDAAAPRTRVLARRAPSDLEGGGRVDLGRLLRLDTSVARLEGTLVHRWCEEVGWIEEGLPPSGELEAAARREAAGLAGSEIARLEARFRSWMAEPAVRRALSREGSLERAVERLGEGPAAAGPSDGRGPEGELALELATERRFAARVDHEVMAGTIDRLVLARRGPVVTAEILDFKTDAVPPGDEGALTARVEHYRPQLDAYRRAVASTYGLSPAEVAARLVFLTAGAVRDV